MCSRRRSGECITEKVLVCCFSTIEWLMGRGPENASGLAFIRE